MKKIPILKSIFGILLTLAVIGTLVVAAVPVAADSTYITILEGGNSYPISASAFAGLTHISIPMVCEYIGKSVTDNLASNATSGTNTVVLTSILGLTAPETVTISDSSNSESVQIASINAGTDTLTLVGNLTNSYTTANTAKITAANAYHTYSGVPVYTIMASVGLGGLSATNYDIKANGGGYITLVGPTVPSSDPEDVNIAGNNNLIVADSNEAGPLTSGTLACSSWTAGKYFNGTLTSLELVYTVSATAGSNGTVTPNNFVGNITYSGIVPVSYGSNQAFNITPTSGNYIATLTTDTGSNVLTSPYTFYNVTGNHTLAATFATSPPAASSTSVYISPSSQTVANGGTFNVNLSISTTVAARGWQTNVNFDATKMTLNSVSEGTFLKNYATANGGGTLAGGTATIDNTNGVAIIPGYIITGAGAGGPTGTGTLAVLSFTAKSSINNTGSITPASVVISNVSGGTMAGVTVTGGSVAIGTIPLPDLIVSSASTTAVSGSPNKYTITYTVTNQGTLAAGASATSISINGGTPVSALAGSIPALAASGTSGNSATITTAAQTVSASGYDAIVITADSGNAITESNENNNTGTTSYSYVAGPPANGANVQLNGLIQPYLQFTAPSSVTTWGSGSQSLSIGTNDAWGTMNVISNESWNVQVAAATPSSGSMCLYNNATPAGYVSPLVQLGHALVINSPIPSLPISGITPVSVTLTGSNQTIGQRLNRHPSGK